jgi:hypothetical protein
LEVIQRNFDPNDPDFFTIGSNPTRFQPRRFTAEGDSIMERPAPVPRFRRLGARSRTTPEEEQTYQNAANEAIGRNNSETSYGIWDPENMRDDDMPLGYYYTGRPGNFHENVQIGDHMDILETGPNSHLGTEGPTSVFDGYRRSNDPYDQNIVGVLDQQNLVLPNYNRRSPPGYTDAVPGPERFVDPNREYSPDQLLLAMLADASRANNEVQDEVDRQNIERRIRELLARARRMEARRHVLDRISEIGNSDLYRRAGNRQISQIDRQLRQLDRIVDRRG